MTILVLLAAVGGSVLIPGGTGPCTQFAVPAFEPAVDSTDTVLFYDSGVTTTWWCSDRDSFGTAVKFTPGEYPCEVLASRAEVNYDNGREIYLRVWDDDGPQGKPGTVLYNELRLDVPRSRTPGWQDYSLSTPVRVDSGDFYIVWWQRHIFDLVFSSDDAMNYPARQWWYFPDQGWVPPSGMDASDHMIRALVRYGSTGVVEELGAVPVGPALRIAPNPASGGRVSIEAHGLTGPADLRLVDAAGRVVLRRRLTADAGRATLSVETLRRGVYVACLTEPYRTTARSFTVNHR